MIQIFEFFWDPSFQFDRIFLSLFLFFLHDFLAFFFQRMFSVSFCFDSKFSFMSSAELTSESQRCRISRFSPVLVFFCCCLTCLCFVLLCFASSLRKKAKLIFLWRIDAIWQKYSWREKQVFFSYPVFPSLLLFLQSQTEAFVFAFLSSQFLPLKLKF